MVAKFRADSLFKATVQPDDKNSEKHVLLVLVWLFSTNYFSFFSSTSRLLTSSPGISMFWPRMKSALPI